MADLDLKGGGGWSDVESKMRRLAAQFDDQEKTIRRLNAENRKLGRQTRRTSQAQEHAFGPRGVRMLTNYAAGFATIGTAIAGIRKLAQKMREEVERGVQDLRQSALPLGGLGEVATKGRPLPLLMQEVTRTRLETGMGVDEATRFQHALESRGMGSSRKWLAELYGSTDPTAITHAAGAVTAGFGRAEVGSDRQVVNKLLAAAKRSPLTAADFAGVVGGLGPAFRTIKGREEEALAATAAGARAAGGEQGATAMARLATFIAGHQRFAGKGFFGAVGQIQQETAGMSAAQFTKYMPELRARRGFQLFQANRGLIMETLADIESAGGEAPGADWVSRVVAEREAQPELELVRGHRRAIQGRKIRAAGSPRAGAELEADRMVEAITAEGGRPELQRRFTAWLTRILTPKTQEPWMLEKTGHGYRSATFLAMEKAVEQGTARGSAIDPTDLTHPAQRLRED